MAVETSASSCKAVSSTESLLPASCKRKRHEFAETSLGDDVEPFHNPASSARLRNTPQNMLCHMMTVEQMTQTVPDKATGLPVKHITVMGSDETLCDFKVEIRLSNLPNAGHGAFLTYLGARVLKRNAECKSEELMSARAFHFPRTMETLDAVMPDGCAAAVKITGDNLHGNGNSVYWPKSQFKKAVLRRGGAVDAPPPGEGINKNENIRQSADALGHLGIHSKCDYVPNNAMAFCSKDDPFGMIDLGRYGPFFKEDRKRKADFDLKNFIFGNEPSCWSFGINEQLHGCEQLIDITDDATGDPHDCAKEDIPMYVNEVGHNADLVQNVYALEKDNRVVHYYISIDHPMQKGETVELLTDYKKGYEDCRERKGYGLAKMKLGVKGDKDNESKMRRNLLERKEIKSTIDEMDTNELLLALKFIETRVLGPVRRSIEQILKAHQSGQDAVNPPSPPPFRQWVAWCRLEWLGQRFSGRLAELRSIENGSTQKGSREGLLDRDAQFAQRVIGKMRWNPFRSIAYCFAGRSSKMYSDFEVLPAIFEELSEVALCDATHTLVRPYDESLWCSSEWSQLATVCNSISTICHTLRLWLTPVLISLPLSTGSVACGLTKTLINLVITSRMLDNSPKRQRKLAEKVLEAAQNAAEEVRNACRTRSSAWKLGFTCNSPSDKSKEPNAFSRLPSKNARQCEHDGLPRGHSKTSPTPSALAALAEHQEKGGEAKLIGQWSPEWSGRSCNEPFVVCTNARKQGEPASAQEGNSKRRTGELPVPCGTPRFLRSVWDEEVLADETWYLQWQVVFVVDAVARGCIDWGAVDGEDKPCSFHKLFRAVGLRPVDRVQEAFKRGHPLINNRTMAPTAHVGAMGREDKEQKRRRSDSARPPSTGSDRTAATAYNRLFRHIVINQILIRDLKWRIEQGKRPHDVFFFPPGVMRGQDGAKQRVDFFDSNPSVREFISTDPRWKDLPQVKEGMRIYSHAVSIYASLSAKNNLPEKFSAEWFERNARTQSDGKEQVGVSLQV